MMVKTSSVVGFYLKHASELFIVWLPLTSCITNKTENLSITVMVYLLEINNLHQNHKINMFHSVLTYRLIKIQSLSITASFY